MPDLRTINAMDAGTAIEALQRCCGARRWAEVVATARPFATEGDFFADAERVWNELSPVDWLEAFAAHPRIGGAANSAWSRAEQSGVAGAGSDLQADLARLNREYEARFGHVFLICATGRSAAEMLTELRRRLHHDPADELRLAAAEQAKITQLRLVKLLTAPAQEA